MKRQVARQLPTLVGHNIRLARQAQHLTQRDLGKSLDIDGFQVSRWERGLHIPSDETMFALAHMLADGDVSWFYVDRTADDERSVAA